MTSQAYEEIFAGETVLRQPPGARHETICLRLLELLSDSLARTPGFRLLEPRSVVQLAAGTIVRPDLAVLSAESGMLWLAVEVISSDDHRADTVIKKALYEDSRVPLLWMVDPRYDNVEVYRTNEYGLVLKGILAGGEVLTDPEMPDLRTSMRDLFREA